MAFWICIVASVLDKLGQLLKLLCSIITVGVSAVLYALHSLAYGLIIAFLSAARFMVGGAAVGRAIAQ